VATLGSPSRPSARAPTVTRYGTIGRVISGLSVVKTVDRHRANILAKLGMHDRLQLTRYAIRAGLTQTLTTRT
jgi:hypothetical protein